MNPALTQAPAYPTGFKQAIIVVTAISAAIMELIDTSIVNVALNQISGNLGATLEDIAWIITAYAIANVIIIPMTSFLISYFGRKSYFVGSIVVFTLASYLCGNSTSLWELVAFRFIQGIGGGGLLSTAQGILFDAFPPKNRALASAAFGMGIVVGPSLGPSLGGYLIDNYDWPLIFYINLPIGILATLFTILFVDKKPEEYNIDRSQIKIDYVGIVLLAIGIGALQFILERGENDDWFASPTIRAMSAAAGAGLTLFVGWELWTKTPVVDLRVLKNRTLTTSLVLTFVVGFGLYCSIFLFPVWVQRINGFTPTLTGLTLIPGSLIAVFIFPPMGILLQRGVSPRIFIALGFGVYVLFNYFMALQNGVSSSWDFFLPLLMRGIGLPLLNLPLINQSVADLEPRQLSSGIALTNMVRQLGGAFGIALANTYVTIQTAVHRNDLIEHLAPENPLYLERITQVTNGLIARGFDVLKAQEQALRSLDFTITQQASLLSYIDAFELIGLFFILAFPLVFLLKSRKLSAEESAAIAEHAH